MYLGLDGVVFRGQTERVEPHGLEHFVALHFFEPCIAVGGAVVVPMPDVQLRTGRVGEHFQNIELFIDVLFVEVVFLRLFPTLLPLAFHALHIHKNNPSEACRLLIFFLQKVCISNMRTARVQARAG